MVGGTGTVKTVFHVLVVIVSGFLFVAWLRFQYANPKANSMSFWREFRQVVTFQVLEKYQ